jgi:hypothetical protein
MNAKRFALLAASVALLATRPAAAQNGRSAYSYVRETSGEVLVVSPSNGEVQARRNLPISAGDEMKTEDPARAEVALADGNVLHVGGGTRIKFVSLSSQQESDVSAIELSDGSVILSVVGSDDQAIPRIDTSDVTVYANDGARVRVNADVRRGTAVVVRAGSVEVKARAGTYTVRAGNYLLVQGDQEPEIARGSFSRDRFDLWAADRLEAAYDAPQSASSRYVEDDYAADVQTLDGYGDWDYSSTYSTYVWRPTVAVGWSPYSYGSWYNTPIGLSWWSSDPWGWYPYHYGNWFFDAGWNSWCWTPGYVYSPAWVYWGYTSSYFGWCPTGYYGYYSPWWNTYYRNIGWGRDSVAFAINGRFSTRQVDMRGWNFTGVNNLATRGRLDVVPGTRIVDRLGGDLHVSSRTIVLSDRRGGARDALRDHVREAPALIERTTTTRDSQRLAPVLARERTLPNDTVDALRERTVSAQRGRLVGPGVSEFSSRATVDRGRVPLESPARRPETTLSDRERERQSPATGSGRGRVADAPDRNVRNETSERGRRPDSDRPATRPETQAQDSWRGRPEPRADAPARAQNERRATAQDNQDWRSRPSQRSPSTSTDRQGPARAETSDRNAREGWRSRPDVPPAQRVIEGSVPGRRAPSRDSADDSRHRGFDRNARPTAPRDSGPSDRGRGQYSAPQRGSAPQRDSAPPRSMDRSSPAPRQAPQAAPRSAPAPAPRSAPAPAAPRGNSAPPSSGSRGRP